MAFYDIDFNEGEGQDFIVEVPIEISHPALDILIDSNESQLILETPLIISGGGETSSVFIS